MPMRVRVNLAPVPGTSYNSIRCTLGAAAAVFESEKPASRIENAQACLASVPCCKNEIV